MHEACSHRKVKLLPFGTTVIQGVEYWSYFVSDTRVPYRRFQIKFLTKIEDTLLKTPASVSIRIKTLPKQSPLFFTKELITFIARKTVVISPSIHAQGSGRLNLSSPPLFWILYYAVGCRPFFSIPSVDKILPVLIWLFWNDSYTDTPLSKLVPG